MERFANGTVKFGFGAGRPPKAPAIPGPPHQCPRCGALVWYYRGRLRLVENGAWHFCWPAPALEGPGYGIPMAGDHDERDEPPGIEEAAQKAAEQEEHKSAISPKMQAGQSLTTTEYFAPPAAPNQAQRPRPEQQDRPSAPIVVEV